jgi:predicted DNA-binding transcriptional regulator AlpA
VVDIHTAEAIAQLADELWARMIGANAEAAEFHLLARLALEQRLLGLERPAFGLDKLDSAETARYIGQQQPTLHDKKKRDQLGLPPPYNIGRKLFWRRSELDVWIEEQRALQPTEGRQRNKAAVDPYGPPPRRGPPRRIAERQPGEA